MPNSIELGLVPIKADSAEYFRGSIVQVIEFRDNEPKKPLFLLVPLSRTVDDVAAKLSEPDMEIQKVVR